jgi:enolase
MKITNLQGSEILDSLGNPTIECTLTLDNKIQVKSSVPSGTSVGKYEAHELRDYDKTRYLGRGVLKAINNIETKIKPVLVGKEPNMQEIDKILIELDGTENKSNLGANAIIAASMAVARAQAAARNIELFQLINQEFGIGPTAFPLCMFNILNGGAHADNKIAFQEFMIMPKKFNTMHGIVQCAATIYHALRKILVKDGLSVGVGHEGGFAPILNINTHKEQNCLDYLIRAIEEAGFEPDSVGICLDVAASQFFDNNKNGYLIENRLLSSKDLAEFYATLIENYPIISIEDGMAEDDWYGWEMLTQKLGKKIQIVGDDLFVTNIHRIKKGVGLNVANAVLIKPNQIGTVSETVQAIKFCKSSGYKTIVSHRSGETNDSFIADLVIGTAAGQIKAGAPCRGERVAKYNRLMEIEAKF